MVVYDAERDQAVPEVVLSGERGRGCPYGSSYWGRRWGRRMAPRLEGKFKGLHSEGYSRGRSMVQKLGRCCQGTPGHQPRPTSSQGEAASHSAADLPLVEPPSVAAQGQVPAEGPRRSDSLQAACGRTGCSLAPGGRYRGRQGPEGGTRAPRPPGP